MSTQILITGGAGYIGSVLMPPCSRGHSRSCCRQLPVQASIAGGMLHRPGSRLPVAIAVTGKLSRD